MKKLNSIFSKLLISFLCLVVPVYIVAMIIFSWAGNIVEEEIKYSTDSHIQHLKSSLEIEIQRINILQYDLVNDRDLIAFIQGHGYIPRYNYYILVGQVQRRLRIIKNSNALIENVIVHFPRAGIRISSNDGLIDYDEKAFNHLLNTHQERFSPLVIEQLQIYSATPFPVRADYSLKNPTFLIEIQLSEQMLSNYLNQFSAKVESHIMIYDYNSDVWFRGVSTEEDFIDDAHVELLGDNIDRQREIKTIYIFGNKFLLITAYSEYLHLSVVTVLPVDDIFTVLDQFRVYLLIFAASLLCVVGLYALLMHREVNKPINIILESFKDIEKGILDTRIKFKSTQEFEKLYDGFNNMARKLNNLIDKVYRQELYTKRTELKQLQTQINPHFFYNSYFMMNRMIKEGDTEGAALLSSYLGEYFEYITRNSRDEVTLSYEIKHLKNYVNIQVMRFSGLLEVKMGELPSQFKDCIIPRMVLQPVLENAVEYGFKKNMNGIGLILIDFETRDNRLDIIIEDSGKNITDEIINQLRDKLECTTEDMEITGIINVHKRIRIIFGKESGLLLERSKLGGLKVRIRILQKQKG